MTKSNCDFNNDMRKLLAGHGVTWLSDMTEVEDKNATVSALLAGFSSAGVLASDRGVVVDGGVSVSMSDATVTEALPVARTTRSSVGVDGPSRGPGCMTRLGMFGSCFWPPVVVARRRG